MKVRAAITAAYKSSSYSTKDIYEVSEFFVDSAMDTDTDSWQITVGDFDNKLTSLLHRDSEVRCNIFVEGDGKFEALNTGIADEISWNDEGMMIINGRDLTSVAVDSKHPPQRYKAARPEIIVRKEANEIGIGASLKLSPTRPNFKQLVTDGSESYWQFWYRIYRKRRMWVWAEADGTIVAAPLNYNQKPIYYFGDTAGLGKGYDKFNFVPVESMTWRANKQQRVAVSYVYGHRGDKVAFVEKAVDPGMKNWIKRPIAIVASQSAHGPGEAHAEALEEIFESKVGATEITIVIANPEKIIRQDRMCFLNISSANVRGEFYVVGSRIVGSVGEGLYQEVRLREQNYAISKRLPEDPNFIQSPGDTAMYGKTPMGGIGPANLAGTVSGSAGNAIAAINPKSKGWGSYFVEATDKHHGPWPFALFLGTLLAICEHETHFRNIRYNGFSGPDYPGTADGQPPSVVMTAEYNKFASRYANEPKYGRVAAPPGFDQWAVGPMQLYTPSYKEYADKISGSGIDELYGGRWMPRYNIIAGAFALRSKLSGFEATLDPGNAAQAYSLIWQGVASYGGADHYGTEIRKIYDDSFAEAASAAVADASAVNRDKTPVTVPQGTSAELRRQVLNNKKITFSSSANTGDITSGIVTDGLLKIMIAFANAGFDGLVWVFKTGHDYNTSSGGVSQHSFGKAVDYGNYRLGDDIHEKAQTWLCAHAKQLGIRQVIGPNDMMCYDFRVGTGEAARIFYSGITSNGKTVLQEHDNHIHLGATS